MPLFLQPEPTQVIPTKAVRPVDRDGNPLFDTFGAFEEHFDILTYLDEKVDKAANELATKTITGPGGKSDTEFTHEIYVRELVRQQLKGWRVIAPPGAEAEPERVEHLAPPPDSDPDDLDGYDQLWFWKFTPYNVAKLSWDTVSFLFGDIRQCGGIIATRNLKVKTAKGQVLDFQSAHTILWNGHEPARPPKK